VAMKRLNALFFPYWEHKLSPKEVETLIKELAKKHNVPVPEWRIVGEGPKPEKVEKPKFGPVTTFQTKTIHVSGTFMGASDGTGSIEFYGLPTKETVEHEFKHYVEWLHGTPKAEKIW